METGGVIEKKIQLNKRVCKYCFKGILLFCHRDFPGTVVKAAKKSLPIMRGFVNWLGLEPRTHTLKVYCSTN